TLSLHDALPICQIKDFVLAGLGHGIDKFLSAFAQFDNWPFIFFGENGLILMFYIVVSQRVRVFSRSNIRKKLCRDDPRRNCNTCFRTRLSLALIDRLPKAVG